MVHKHIHTLKNGTPGASFCTGIATKSENANNILANQNTGIK